MNTNDISSRPVTDHESRITSPPPTSPQAPTAALPTTRTGKIARLPHEIRDQLNRRLQDGHKAKTILAWLNSLPEVRDILEAHFHGHPIAPCNLTEWKQGGYRDWLVAQDNFNLVCNLQDEHAFGHAAFAGSFASKLARWGALYYASCAHSLLAAETDPGKRWEILQRFCADISRLRRGDLHAERISLDRDWLALEDRNATYHKEQDFIAWAKDPEIRERHFPELTKKSGGLTAEAIAEMERALKLL